jgi:hypothetical protein
MALFSSLSGGLLPLKAPFARIRLQSRPSHEGTDQLLIVQFVEGGENLALFFLASASSARI